AGVVLGGVAGSGLGVFGVILWLLVLGVVAAGAPPVPPGPPPPRARAVGAPAPLRPPCPDGGPRAGPVGPSFLPGGPGRLGHPGRHRAPARLGAPDPAGGLRLGLGRQRPGPLPGRLAAGRGAVPAAGDQRREPTADLPPRPALPGLPPERGRTERRR